MHQPRMVTLPNKLDDVDRRIDVCKQCIAQIGIKIRQS
jgi:hypothetical protein